MIWWTKISKFLETRTLVVQKPEMQKLAKHCEHDNFPCCSPFHLICDRKRKVHNHYKGKLCTLNQRTYGIFFWTKGWRPMSKPRLGGAESALWRSWSSLWSSRILWHSVVDMQCKSCICSKDGMYKTRNWIYFSVSKICSEICETLVIRLWN